MDREFEISTRITLRSSDDGCGDVKIRFMFDNKSDIYLTLWESGFTTLAGQYGPTAATFYTCELDDVPFVLSEKIKEYVKKENTTT